MEFPEQSEVYMNTRFYVRTTNIDFKELVSKRDAKSFALYHTNG